MKKLTRAAIYLFLIALLAPRAMMAQATASGTVQGTISDSSQAVVNGADVTITSVATGMSRTMVTNNLGTYRFDLLSAGGYKLTVKSNGFSTVVKSIELLVGQTATANVTLTPGATSQTVEVAGSNPLVDVMKTSVSAEITPTEVQELADGGSRRGQPRVPRSRCQVCRFLRSHQGALRHPLCEWRRRPQRERDRERRGQQGQHGRRTGDAAAARSGGRVPHQHAAILG